MGVYGAKASDVLTIDIQQQLHRLVGLEDITLRYAFLGALITGISTGWMGSFLVVRRLSMLGDTLAHSILPGLVLGFILAQGRDELTLFVSALMMGYVGVCFVSWVKKKSYLKEDAALSLVLSGFYAIGIVLLTMVQHTSIGQKTGLEKIFFGQAAALSSNDLWLMGLLTAIISLFMLFFYKELLLFSFDSVFARATTPGVRVIELFFQLGVTAVIVSALKTSGVILVSAMLIIPSSTAYLITQSMPGMIVWSIVWSVFSGIVGVGLSFLKPGLATGPCMVVTAGSVFFIVWIGLPKNGLLGRFLSRLKTKNRIMTENLLKMIYHLLEQHQFQNNIIPIQALATMKKIPIEIAKKQINHLVQQEFGMWNQPDSDAHTFTLTASGWVRACQIVRNHRLWELYLTHVADYPTDHVHDDAEKIEHILGEDVVRQIESRLNYPQKDPHGQLIPSLIDMQNPKFTRSPFFNR